jgi:2,3,4,5-tetrahydropyridine-2-carboxylate N-succinyltransferase
MPHQDLPSVIDAAWETREVIGTGTTGQVRDAVETALALLDKGEARVAEKVDGAWQVNQWLKKAVLLSFRLNDMAPIAGGPGRSGWYDKVASKFDGWDEARFRAAGFRAVPNCTVRYSAFIAPGVVLMPCFVNLGAHVGSGTMRSVPSATSRAAPASAACSSPCRRTP